MEVRGFIVNLKLKEAKSRLSISRAYSTSRKESSSTYLVSSRNYKSDLGSPVSGRNEGPKINEDNLGFERIARL